MKVCFFRPHAISYFMPWEEGYIAGGEIQAIRLSEVVASFPGNWAQLIIRAPKVQPILLSFRDIGLQNAWPDSQGINLSWPASAETECEDCINHSDADVFCFFGITKTSFRGFKAATNRKKPAVLFITSDRHLEESHALNFGTNSSYAELANIREEMLLKAARVFAQTEDQRQRLRCTFGVYADILPVPISSRWHAGRDIDNTKRTFALWVGRAEIGAKRPECLIKLSAMCPSTKFLMVLNCTNPSLFNEIVEAAPSNVRVLNRVAPRDMWRLLHKAKMLVNTSEWEGFPNVFLEAALSSTPIVTLAVDPDKLLSEGRCGFTAESNLDQLAEIVRGITDGSVNTVERTQKMRAYCEANHDSVIVGHKFLSILDEVLQKSSENLANLRHP